MDTNLSCSAPEHEVGPLAFPASAADAMGSAFEALNCCILRMRGRPLFRMISFMARLQLDSLDDQFEAA